MIDLTKISKKFGIYQLTYRGDGKKYIGKANNLYKRIKQHSGHYHNQYICNAIKKHGWENFEVEILAEFDKIDNLELLALETAFIVYEDSLSPNGYNICLFSNDATGRHHTDETKRQMSKNARKPWIGKKLSEEHRKNLGLSRLGKKRAPMSEGQKEKLRIINTGKTISEETKHKISLASSGENNGFYGKHHSEETKIKLSLIDKSYKKKSVSQLKKKTGEIIKIWPSIKEAVLSLGKTKSSNVTLVCQGKKKSYLGYKWEYV
jgi:hypothetical protein